MKILVTGGASGLGEAITRKLAQNPENSIIFTYNKSVSNAELLLTQLPNTIAVYCDFNDLNSVNNLLIEMKVHDLDALVNNALTNLTKNHFHKIDLVNFALSFENNVLPVLSITQEAIRIFRKKKFGRIVNVLTSFLINTPPLGLSEYVANKAYLLEMSKSWAIENINFNITSNSVSPSLMSTDLKRYTDERILAQMIESHPLKKILTTEEVAESVNFLINSSSNINGINLVMNAGIDIV